MFYRHLNVPADTAAENLPIAAIAELLDRGDLTDWLPLRRAVSEDPWGIVASRILDVCAAVPMYGTSPLWQRFILSKRSQWVPDDKPDG